MTYPGNKNWIIYFCLYIYDTENNVFLSLCLEREKDDDEKKIFDGGNATQRRNEVFIFLLYCDKTYD